ncbi:MAG: NAD(P)-binding domain-containing protein [Acidobacteria bacterium]|nr:NAD(P)-binding domain-containing protein [Acidobacteriota bacterium]
MPLQSQPACDAALAIVGAGRMASALGALLSRRGIPILAVAGRSPHSTAEAARFIGAARAVTLSELPAIAPRILIAVSDDALDSVASELAAAGLHGALVLHTCGAAGPAALAPLRAAASSTGVLHPLQTVPSAEVGVLSLPGSAFAYAGDPAAAGWAR